MQASVMTKMPSGSTPDPLTRSGYHSGNEGHIDKFSFLRFFRFRGNFSAYIGTSFIYKHFKQL